MKINRDNLSKFFARFGLIIMSFVIMIPMLCSMAFPVTITISNPDNVPYFSDSFSINGTETVSFGSYQINSPIGEPFDIVDGNIIFPDSDPLHVIGNIPDGKYIVDYTIASFIDSTAQSYLLPADVDLFPSCGIYSADSFFLFILGDVTDFTIQVDDFSGATTQLTYVIHPYEAPTPTDSITNVWTGIMNWITSSLNTVQGLFLTETSGTSVLEAGTYTFNESLIDFPTEQNKVYFGYDVIVDSVPTQVGIVYYSNFLFPGGTDTLTGYAFGGYVSDPGYLSPVYVDPAITDGGSNWLTPKSTVDSRLGTITNDSTVDSVFADWYIKNTDYLDYHDAPVTNGGGYELTLLGTLAVIGLSIALCFLIIGVIQRSLRLRG